MSLDKTYFEQMEAKIPHGRVRTRFAPSPTGYMHVGNLRTALYTWLIARSHGGDFILRIEDTDQGRYVDGAVDVIYRTMAECGLTHDEGPDVGGPVAPYIQSQRRDTYGRYARLLVEKGGAYYCFCEKTESEEDSGDFDRAADPCRDLPLEEVEIETPITMAKTKVLAGRKLALVPILRAGMGMLDGMLTLLPAAKVGFIGLYRDEETLQPVEYFCKLPKDIAERDVLVLDPMLATGGSAIDAITQIKKHGAKRIKFIGLIAAPEGIKALHEAHPDVDIYLGAQDDHLNENGYIVPGLGDAGDRIYGTK